MNTVFTWNKQAVKPEINDLLEVLQEYYPERFSAENGCKELRFEDAPEGCLKVTHSESEVVIQAFSTASAARGIGFAFAGENADENTTFRTIGVMIDCSRNKVLKLSWFKQYLLCLALDGCNSAMLYLEDTYKMPNHPLFGYMRSAYTMEQLQELDAFASRIGIELFGCIQTLGHMHQYLWQPAAGSVKDTNGVLLVDSPDTTKLITDMLDFWSRALKSRRIHVGMDECHGLGRGRFLDLHGYENPETIYLRHLAHVAQLCENAGLKPIIWSDMIFSHLSEKHAYYDMDVKIDPQYAAKIPDNVQLCYWDYIHFHEEFYTTYIDRHRELHGEPVMGAGVWTWHRLWYDHPFTRSVVVPCVSAARKKNLQEIFFTMWGDNGGYCISKSSLAGMEYATGLCWGEDPDSMEALNTKRFRAICRSSYDAYIAASKIYSYKFNNFALAGLSMAEEMFWDDPLMGDIYTYYINSETPTVMDELAALTKEALAGIPDHECEQDASLACIREEIRVVQMKIEARKELLAAYDKKDRTTLQHLADSVYPAIAEQMRKADALIRNDWHNTAYAAGLEVIQGRNWACMSRLYETANIIQDYLNGKVDRIEQLDEALKVLKSGEKVPKFVYTASHLG